MKRNVISRFISDFFRKGHQRSILAKKNIVASFFIKGFNIAIGLALVPLTIDYLDPTKYGIWITLSSIIGWFGFFDIGLGHGLRNKLAESLAKDNIDLARKYVSTTYAILSIIIGSILILFFILNPFLEWNKILNAGDSASFEAELSLLALIVFTFFCLRFIFKLIATILLADQRPAISSLFDMISKLLSLLAVIILTKTTQESLLYLGIAISGMPVLVLLVSSIWFYKGKYRKFSPSFKYIDFSKAGDLLNLGIKFFILQIAVVLLYQTNNIIISHLFGPAEVTPYNIAFKYFNIIMMGFSIIITPFWSAITDAWTKMEFTWIKSSIRNLSYIWILMCIGGIGMLAISKWVYRLWIGDEISIPFSLSALVMVWVLVNSWNGIFSQFLNGVGKIHIQIRLGIIGALLNVPLAIFLGRKIGIEGVIMANIIVLIASTIIYPLQYSKLINRKASGIWNK